MLPAEAVVRPDRFLLSSSVKSTISAARAALFVTRPVRRSPSALAVYASPRRTETPGPCAPEGRGAAPGLTV